MLSERTNVLMEVEWNLHSSLITIQKYVILLIYLPWGLTNKEVIWIANWLLINAILKEGKREIISDKGVAGKGPGEWEQTLQNVA